MKDYSYEFIRNVALIGHSGEGKTSVAEAMMFEAKTTTRLGKVDDGTSTMDYDDEEIRRKISISMAFGYAIHKNNKINIMDVPGFFDFEGDMIAALSATDSAIIVTQASGSLTVGTERAIDVCSEMKVPALLFVNGVEKENADFFATIDAISANYPSVIPIEAPIMKGGKMVGYVDILSATAYDLTKKKIDMPAELEGKVSSIKDKLMEMVAESDEELTLKFFDGEEFTPEEIRRGFLVAIDNGAFITAIAGNATPPVGIVNLLDRIVDLLPNPEQIHEYKGTKDGAEVELKVDPSKPFVAQVFKSVVDPYAGKMNIFKVIQGKVSSGDTVWNATQGKPERIGTIYVVCGKKQESVASLSAGDIGAFSKLANTFTNDTLCDQSAKITVDPIKFPSPVISLAVTAPKDEEKVIQQLIKMQDEDPTFKVEKNIETGDVLVSGLGEAQLDIMCRKVKNKIGLDSSTRAPRIPYHETINGVASAEGKHKKQNGGAGQFGDVFIKFEPGAADGYYEFVDAIVGGAVPNNFIPAVDKGLREAIQHGVLAGYPVYNLKCTLYDGKYHPVDSKEIAFVTAARLSFQEALPKANPCFLEPIYKVAITVPTEFQGTILADVTSQRRGQIMDSLTTGKKTTITVEAPYAELYRYATDLRSMTQGKGRFTMEFVRYEVVPQMYNKAIIEDAKKRAEEDAARKANQ